MRLQKRKERKRLELGLDEKITDYSMQRKYHQTSEAEVHGKEGLDDRTDVENEYFTYLRKRVVRDTVRHCTDYFSISYSINSNSQWHCRSWQLRLLHRDCCERATPYS